MCFCFLYFYQLLRSMSLPTMKPLVNMCLFYIFFRGEEKGECVRGSPLEGLLQTQQDREARIPGTPTTMTCVRLFLVRRMFGDLYILVRVCPRDARASGQDARWCPSAPGWGSFAHLLAQICGAGEVVGSPPMPTHDCRRGSLAPREDTGLRLRSGGGTVVGVT